MKSGSLFNECLFDLIPPSVDTLFTAHLCQPPLLGIQLISLFLATETFSFPQMEEEMLEYWKKIDAFNQSLKLSEGRPE